MQLEKHSIGIGDRFARQGVAQLRALEQAAADGIHVVPVWNKSFREHSLVGTVPADVRREAAAAVKALHWQKSFYVDADHISLKNVDGFVESSDFFTLDVADYTGKPADDDALRTFTARHEGLTGDLRLPGLEGTFRLTREALTAAARKYLLAVQEAGRLFRHIAGRKPPERFVTEVSMDETDRPQTPMELLVILAAIADEGIPAQTVAPKFSGRFNKGVDYVGDVAVFAREFEEDLAVIAFAVERFGLPSNLKLSVHSGSDKFSIYEPMRCALRKYGAGLHLKTAGTTWLEEVIGLAEHGGQPLDVARDIYRHAFGRLDELCGPYATVISIRRERLPAPEIVAGWSGSQYAAALRHDPACPAYNPDLRQLVHVGYKIAAEMGARFLDALDTASESIAANVTENLHRRHIVRVFPAA
ncbi:MAG: hypothetical protein BWZ02_03112 [Lentisphaerae bacterium ADurb.BinA184]|nr:MAG: hypothetical protein BWZ02_03112 [Lentisphaerae bacterium ADurb.BinA184]